MSKISAETFPISSLSIPRAFFMPPAAEATPKSSLQMPRISLTPAETCPMSSLSIPRALLIPSVLKSPTVESTPMSGYSIPPPRLLPSPGKIFASVESLLMNPKPFSISGLSRPNARPGTTLVSFHSSRIEVFSKSL
jgi:hypothetical protein